MFCLRFCSVCQFAMVFHVDNGQAGVLGMACAGAEPGWQEDRRRRHVTLSPGGELAARTRMP